MAPADVIVIGAGHNGLVAANYLADAGLKVTVLERRGVIGGATVTEELIPGFRSSSCAYVVGLLHPSILAELELARHGLILYQSDVGDVNLLEDGRHLVLWNDLSRTLRELERACPGESERFVELGLRLERFAQLTAPWLRSEPPALSEVVAQFEAAGEGQLFTEFFTLSISDLLDRYLEYDLLKGFLSFYALVSAWGGPSTPGWTLLYGHHATGEYEGRMGQYAFPRGGMGSVAEALAARGRLRGVEIRTNADVEQVVVRNGRITGVTLRSGEEIPARAVASGADPRRTFMGMVDRRDLPDDFIAVIEQFDMRGSMARVHIALDGLPDFVGMEPGPGPHCRGLTLLGAQTERFEGAWEAERRNAIPNDFPIEFLLQSVHDDSLAPPGKHLLITGVQQLPFELADGTWDERKDQFTKQVIDTLTRYAPKLEDHVIDTYTITPLDLEREYGLTGGNIFHGAMTFGQVFGARPAIGWGSYRTPVRGLYLCGSGAHPGGGVMGLPGRNAAYTIARDLVDPMGSAAATNGARRRVKLSPAWHRPIRAARSGATARPIDRLMARPTARRVAVKLARQPALSRVVDRVSRRPQARE